MFHPQSHLGQSDSIPTWILPSLPRHSRGGASIPAWRGGRSSLPNSPLLLALLRCPSSLVTFPGVPASNKSPALPQARFSKAHPGVNSIGERLRIPRGRACTGLIRESALAATPEVKPTDPEYFGMFIPSNQLFHWVSLGKPGLCSVPRGKQLSLIFHIIFLFFFFPIFFFIFALLPEPCWIFSHLPCLPAPVIIGFNHWGDVFMD